MERGCTSYRHGLLLIWALLQPGAVAHAADYYGRVNTAAFLTHEQYPESIEGSTTNDAWSYFASAYVDATKIGPYQNELTLDVRDKYDYFGGAIDSANLRLIPANEPQLRQLAVKSGKDHGPLAWALGRFPVADAAVLGNDGVEADYRVKQQVKVGAFAGLFPEQRRGRTLQLGREDRQLGAFGSYQNNSPDWRRNTYASTALVLRQPVAAVDPPGTFQEHAVALPDGATTQQAYQPDSGLPQKNYLFWYTNIVHQASERTRFTYLSHVDLEPGAHLRNLWASAYQQLNQRLSGTLSLLRIDLTEYERQRDLRDTLPPSAYTNGRADARYKLAKTLAVEGYGDYGQRGSDGKNNASLNARLVATSLMKGQVSAFAGGGYRHSFISHDELLRAGGSYYAARYEIDGTLQYMIENRDNGEQLHPLIADLSVNSFLSSQLMTSVTVELAKDEKVTIISGLLTLGYRFGMRQLTPIRDHAPRLERL